MNAALWLTAARIAAIPALMAVLLNGSGNGARWTAVGLYLAAAFTDSLDGWLARSRGQVTVAGAFLDPLADKLLVTGALLSLVASGQAPVWAVMVILTREFAVTGLRLVAVSENLVIPAGGLGKAKTVSQNVAIVAAIIPHGVATLNAVLLDIAVVLTVISGAYYFLMARRRLLSDRRPAEDVSADP
ncbi:MAG: CDP-diacylglycerol--glycerol-3-phosphate 3-phosphatidyltransferase [Actinobacteria bacterium]|nr:CDP-diacylglycerol--glycerol-3-phosphate 3-phosphatidyltransferase [Actinomycetota bacterium]